jgi:DNA (cytosine-5)-methyltransferase 1
MTSMQPPTDTSVRMNRGGVCAMSHPQLRFAFGPELIVDLFAGGGGASLAIEQAFGRAVDVAVNHDPIAVAMHRANHPHTRHYVEDVFAVDPIAATGGRMVGLLHASPDCTHHSQARGGQPRSRVIRALSWAVLKWAGMLARSGCAPRVITLENVEQILQWSPLVAKRCPHTRRVVKLDGSVAASGERVPLEQQFLVPCRRRRGHNWQHFVGALRAMGYAVQWRKVCACDYGAGTTRARLFLVARRDGLPIRWPGPTHGKGRGLQPFVTAADCIDWARPCPSIFDRPRPLADATLRRIARGVRRFVLDAAEPFIVPIAHYNGRDSVQPTSAPLRTITAYPRGGSFAVVTAYIEQANTGMTGHDARTPLSTMVGKGCTQRIVTAHLATLRNNCDAADAAAPLSTITADGNHHAVVECTLSPEAEAGAQRVAAFLMRYHSTGGQWADLREPLTTVTTKDRLALVTVTVKGTPYVIVDIGLRMLDREELKRAQGFPDAYIVDHGTDEHGRPFPLSKSHSTHKIGNSVSPPPYRAIVAANVGEIVRAEGAIAA